MTLLEFLNSCKKLIEENPDALKMEMFGSVGSSGCLYEMSTPSIQEISMWDDSEMPIKEMLPSDYELDSVIDVYLGN